MKNAPPASTQQNPVLAQQQSKEEDEKDVGEDETDRKVPSFAETTEKNEEEETVTKPCEASFFLSLFSTSSGKEN
jgi:hypothetical protein